MNSLKKAIKEKGRTLLGAACHFYSPVYVDIIARIGYDVLWIEMEHTHITFPEAANLCRIAAGQGMLTMIRIPDSRRENVLKAAECGPDIIDLPMANSPEPVHELVYHARYTPQGARGFFGSSRAVDYALDKPIAEKQQEINSKLCLMAQIETREAVERADEIAGVDGLDAIFIGPGDMSASYGVPGQIGHPSVMEAIEQAVAAARKTGKMVAMANNPASLGFWAPKGVELFFCTSDVACMKSGAQSVIDEFRKNLDN